MRYSRLLIAAIVLIIVGAFLYFHEFRGKKEKEKEEKIGSLLYNYEVSSIARIDLLIHGEAIEVVKQDGRWMLTRPVEYPADTQAAERIILALKNTKVTSTIDKVSGLQQYNLSPAPITIALTTTSGEKLPPLWIGDETPIGAEFFAMQEGRKEVLVISMDIYPVRELSLYALRDKRLFPFSRWDVSEIALERAGQKIKFRSVEGLWDIMEPIRFPADEGKVSALLNALETAAVKSFVDDVNPTLTGSVVDDPSFRISCRRGADPEWLSITFKEKEEGSLYAVRSDSKPIFVVDKAPFAPAALSSRDFMDMKISKRNRYKVQEFDIAWGNRSEKARIDSANEWVIANTGSQLDKGDIYLLLASLMETRCVDFIERSGETEQRCNYSRPVVSVTIRGEGFTEEIRFSKDPSGRPCTFNSSSQAVIFIVSEKDYDTIEQSLSKSFPG